MKTPWRVTASSYPIATPFLRLRSDTIELPNGTVVTDYFVRESRGFVIIFALTASNEVVLVRQYKHGIGKELLELPAGAIDEGEEPAAAAVREFSEETGYRARLMEPAGVFATDPTSSNSVAHLFIARDIYPASQQKLDPTEDISVERAQADQLLQYVRNGTIDSMPHVAAIYYALDRLGLLIPETPVRHIR